MIAEHRFNSAWWGSPVGKVTSVDFFHQDEEARGRMLVPFAWCEFSMPLADAGEHLVALANAGFVQLDTQVPFKINLKRVSDTLNTGSLRAEFADDTMFGIDIGGIAPFTQERFLCLPGASQARVDARFVTWAQELLEQYPDYCMRLMLDDAVQGWFLAQPGEGQSSGIQLTLAMNAAAGKTAGAYLYQVALREYARRGHRMGWASFSVTNTAVHNIYAGLGAHFMGPVGHWIGPLTEPTAHSMEASS